MSPSTARSAPRTAEKTTPLRDLIRIATACSKRHLRSIRTKLETVVSTLRQLHERHVSGRDSSKSLSETMGFFSVFEHSFGLAGGKSGLSLGEWAVVLSHGFDTAIEDIILDDRLYSWKTDEAYLITAVNLLHSSTRLLIGSARVSDAKLDASVASTVLKRLMSGASRVTAKLWENREFLAARTDLEATGIMTGGINIYLQELIELCNIMCKSRSQTERTLFENYRHTLHRSRLPHLLIWCWTVEVGPVLSCNSMSEYWSALLCSMSFPQNDFSAILEDVITNTIGYDAFAQKLRKGLESPMVLKEGKGACMIHAVYICQFSVPTWMAILRAEVYISVLKLMRLLKDAERSGKRVLKEGEEASIMINISQVINLSYGTTFTEDVQDDTPAKKIMKEHHSDLLELVVHAFVHFPHRSPRDPVRSVPEYYFETALHLGYAYQIWAHAHILVHNVARDFSELELSRLKMYATVIRHDVQKVWYRVLQLLRDADLKPAAEKWLELGAMVELDEAAERAAFQRDVQDRHLRNCDWRGCELFVKLPLKPPHACKGCNRAYYCSHECQIKDWKEGGHKQSCRAIKSY